MHPLVEIFIKILFEMSEFQTMPDTRIEAVRKFLKTKSNVDKAIYHYYNSYIIFIRYISF